MEASGRVLEEELREMRVANRESMGWLAGAQAEIEVLTAKAAQTPEKVHAAREEGLANFQRSTEYRGEILEAWQDEFTRLLVAIARSLLDRGVAPTVTASVHRSLEIVALNTAEASVRVEWPCACGEGADHESPTANARLSRGMEKMGD